MKIETLARRIAQKVEVPALEECLLQGQVPSSTDCMIWTGRKTREGFYSRMVRDGDGRPNMETVMRRSSPLIQFNGKVQYTNRLVFELCHKVTLGQQKLRNLCGESLCINPQHWGQQPLPENEEILPEEDFSTEWTLDEAMGLLEMYLTVNETLNREHALLIDIPDDLLREALEELGKGHLIDGSI